MEGYSDLLFVTSALSRTVEVFSSTGRIKVLSLILRILVHQFCFCCSMELFSSGLERLVVMRCWLLDYISQLSWRVDIKGHWAMQFCGLLGVLITFLRPLAMQLNCGLLGVLDTYLRPLDHILPAFVCSSLLSAAGPRFSYLHFFCLFIILIGLQGRHASH